MMKKMVAVFDTQAKIYAAPFALGTVGEAIRAFSNAVNDPNMGDLHKHPKDFLLFEIGTFDDNTGELKGVMPPIRLGIGSDFAERKELTVK